MKSLEVSNFSGGLKEVYATSDFEDTQSAIVKGLVPLDEVQLVSQGPFQKIGNTAGFTALWVFSGDELNYLVALKSNGSIWWTRCPDRSATYVTTRTYTFTQLTAAGTNANRRITGEIRDLVDNEYVKALCVHGLNAGNAVLIHEEGATLVSRTVSYTTPKTTKVDDVDVPRSGVIPPHTVCAMWQDFPIFGNVMWSPSAARTNTLDSATLRHYGNYAYFGDPTDNTKITTYPARFADEGAVIIGLQAVDSGLLVFTTSASGQSGVIFLNGSPTINTSLNDTPTWKPVVISPGVGIKPGIDTEGTVRTPVHTFWGATQSTVFVNSLGECVHVRDGQIQELDRYGTKRPDTAHFEDHVCALGGTLLMYRDGRLSVMTSYGSDGVWTELVPPEGTILSTSGTEDTFYMLINGQPWRYCIGGPPTSERGLVDGSQVELTLGTRTVGGPMLYQRHWEMIHAQIQGRRNGKLVSVTSSSSGALTSPLKTPVTTVLNQALDLDAQPIGVYAHGPSSDISATLTLKGDVSVVSVYFQYEEGDDRW